MIERTSLLVLTAYRLISPLLEPQKLWRGISGYPRYLFELLRYRSLLAKSGCRSKLELFPCLHDRTSTTAFDPHYCYLAYWASHRLAQDVVAEAELPHVDVGSQISWVMSLAAARRVVFIDIRPFETNIQNLDVKAGTVLELPFPDKSVRSLSCLHVAEHIGLGRYGDPLDPLGTDRAIAELARVLAPDGCLLFALPLGRERVCFNGHRIHDPRTIITLFEQAGLTLRAFAGVGDDRVYREDLDPSDLADADYACGMFEFIRPKADQRLDPK